mgnify:CR=1 FL=1
MLLPWLAKASSAVPPPDVLSSSVFAPPPDATQVTNLLGDDVFKTGLVCYIVGLLALTAWEEWVVPRFSVDSTLPNNLSGEQRRLPWITPLTASTPVPLPTLDTLQTLERYYVGSKMGVAQYITLDAPPRPREGVYEHSQEWSEHYGVEVYVYKKPR